MPVAHSGVRRMISAGKRRRRRLQQQGRARGVREPRRREREEAERGGAPATAASTRSQPANAESTDGGGWDHVAEGVQVEKMMNSSRSTGQMA